MTARQLLTFVLPVTTALLVGTASAQSDRRPTGVLPGALPAPSRAPAGAATEKPAAGSAQAPTQQKGDDAFRIVLQNGQLPSAPTEVDGLVTIVDSLAPDLRFLENYVARLPVITRAMEFDRAALTVREKQRLEQLSPKQIWVAGQIRLGEYDGQKGSFPILASNFGMRQSGSSGTSISMTHADQRLMRALPMSPTEARVVLEQVPNRIVNVLIKARALGAGVDTSGSTFMLNASLFFEPLETTYWITDQKKTNTPFIVAIEQPKAPESGKVTVPQQPSARRQNSIILDQEVLSLLLLKNSPQSVPDSTIVQMIMNRWTFERRRVPTGYTVNEFPRFFTADQPAPHATELRLSVSRFRSWAQDRIQDLSDEFIINFDPFVGSSSDCTAFKLVSSTTSDRNPNHVAELDGILSENSLVLLSNRLSSAISSIPRESSPTLIGPLYFGHPARNEGPSVTPDNYSTRQCIINGHMNWRDTLSSLPQSLRPATYPIGLLRVESWPYVKGSLNELTRARLKITKISLDSDKSGRPRVLLEGRIIRLETTKSITLPSTDPMFNEPPATYTVIAEPAQIAAAEANRINLAQDASPTKTPIAQSFDVVGVTPGMSLNEAGKTIANHMVVKTRLTFKPGPAAAGKRIPFGSGTIFVSGNLDEYVILIHESDVSGGQVVAVGRFVYRDKEGFKFADLETASRTKYGTTPYTQTGGIVHQSAGKRTGVGGVFDGCYVENTSVNGFLVFMNEAGETINTSQFVHDNIKQVLTDLSLLPWIGFRTHYINQGLLNPMLGCRLNATLWMPATGERVPFFATWVSDVHTYAEGLISALTQSAAPARPPRL